MTITDLTRGRWPDLLADLAGLNPVPAQPLFDAPHGFSAHAKPRRNRGRRPSGLAQFFYLFRAEPGSWVPEPLVSGAMHHCVSHVGLRCVPSKVHQPVVVADAVAMARLHPVWAWAHKRLQNKHMNKPPVGLAVFSQCQMQVPFRQWAGLHFFAPHLTHAASRVLYFARKASHTACIADLVEPLEAGNRQPAFGRLSR